jgi:hypothetical protein
MVSEIDLLANGTTEHDPGDGPRGAGLEVEEKLSARKDQIPAPHTVEVIADAYERVPATVHPRPERNFTEEQSPGPVAGALPGGKGAEPAQKALGVERVADFPIGPPIPHLGHEAVVRTKAVAEVLLVAEPVDGRG